MINIQIKTNFPELFKLIDDNTANELLKFINELVENVYEDAYRSGVEEGYLTGLNKGQDNEKIQHQQYRHCVVCNQLSYKLINNICYYCG